MISSLSEAGYLIPRLPHPRSCFFEQPQVQGLLGDDFLQLPRLPLKVRDLAARRCTRRIAGKPLLTGLQELLGLAIMRQLMLSYCYSARTFDP